MGRTFWRIFSQLLRLHVTIAYCLTFIIAFLLFVLWYFQEKLLFSPQTPAGLETPDKNAPPFQHPGQMNMIYEDVWLTTEDNVKIHAWFMKQRDDYSKRPTFIFFQGNAGNMGLRLINLHELYQLCRINILALSYRGFGYSTGTPTENGVYLDAQAALDYLLARTDINHQLLFLFGRSVGGAVAFDLSYHRGHQLRGVVVENTFTNLREVARLVFPVLRFIPSAVTNLVQRLHMNSDEKIKSLSIPVLFISGALDTLIPPSHVKRLYDVASESSPLRRLYVVPNGAHNDTWQQGGKAYYAAISAFIVDALKHPMIENAVYQPNVAGDDFGASTCPDNRVAAEMTTTRRRNSSQPA